MSDRESPSQHVSQCSVTDLSLPPNIADDFVRHPELWFSDGSIVVENGESIFKLYTGLLARKSSVFRDMLTFPQPDGNEETKTVRLYDSTEALTAFFKAIFDPECVAFSLLVHAVP